MSNREKVRLDFVSTWWFDHDHGPGDIDDYINSDIDRRREEGYRLTEIIPAPIDRTCAVILRFERGWEP